MNSGLFTVVATLDFMRAFDTVDHQRMLQKIANMHMSQAALNWFHSYLCDRRQFFAFNNVASDTLPVSHGMPQGSLLGPALFLIYINDLLTKLPENFTIAYADDVTLVASGKLVTVH